MKGFRLLNIKLMVECKWYCRPWLNENKEKSCSNNCRNLQKDLNKLSDKIKDILSSSNIPKKR